MATLNSQITSIIIQITSDNADKVSIENSIKSFNSLIGKTYKDNQVSTAFRESITKWIEISNNRNSITNKVLENFLKFIHQSSLFKTLKFDEFIEYMKWAESEDRLRGEIAINILCTMEGYSYFKNFENGLDFLSQFDYFKLSITTVDKVNKFLEILLEEDSDYINIEYIPMMENILNRVYSTNLSTTLIKPSPRIFNFILNLGKLQVADIENHKKFIPMLRSLLTILAINNASFLKLTKFIFRLVHIICDIPLSNYSFEKRQTIFKNHYSSIIPFIFENFINCKDDLNKLKNLFGEIVEQFSYQHLLSLIQNNRFEKVTLNIISSLKAGPTLEKNIMSIFNTIVCFINYDILRDDAYQLLEHHMPNFGCYMPELHSYVLPLVYKQQHNFPISTFKAYFKSHELLTLSQFPILFKNLSTTRIDIINHTLLTHNKEIIETHYYNFVPKLLEVLLDNTIERPYYVLPSIGSSIQTIGKNEFFDKVVLNISNHLFSIKVLRLDNYDVASIGEIILGLFKIYKAYSKDYVNLWNLGIHTFLYYLNTTSTTMYLIPYVKDVLEKYPIDSIPYVKQFEEKLLKNFEIISINSTNKEIIDQYIELFEKLATIKYFNYLYNYNLKPPQLQSSLNSSSGSLPNFTPLQKSQSINSFSGSSNNSLYKSQSITLIHGGSGGGNIGNSSGFSSSSNNFLNSSNNNLTKSTSNGVLSSFVIHKFTLNKIIDALKLVNSKFRNHKINHSILRIIASLFNEFGMDKKTGNIKQVIGILNQHEIVDLIKSYNLNNSLILSSNSIYQLFSLDLTNGVGTDIQILFNQLVKESRSFVLQYSKQFIRDLVINSALIDQTSYGNQNSLFIGDQKFNHIRSFFNFIISINGDTINNYLLEVLILYSKYSKINNSYNNPTSLSSLSSYSSKNNYNQGNELLEKLICYLIEDNSHFPLSQSNLDYIVQLRSKSSQHFVERIWKVYGLETLKRSKYFDRYYEVVSISNTKLKLSATILNNINNNNNNTTINVPTRSPLSPRPSDNKDLTNEVLPSPSSSSSVTTISNSGCSTPLDSSSTSPSVSISGSSGGSVTSSVVSSPVVGVSGGVKTTSTLTTITKTTSVVETKVNRYSNIAGNGDIIKSTTTEIVEKPTQVSTVTTSKVTNTPGAQTAAGIEIIPNKQNRYSNISGNGDIQGSGKTTSLAYLDKPSTPSSVNENKIEQTASIHNNTSLTSNHTGSSLSFLKPSNNGINVLNNDIYKPTLISQNITNSNSNNNKLLSPNSNNISTTTTTTNSTTQPSPTISSTSSLSSNYSSPYQSLPPSPSVNVIRQNITRSPSGKSYQLIRLKNHIDDYGHLILNDLSKPIPQLDSKLIAFIIKHYVNDLTIDIKEKIDTLGTVSREFFRLLSIELSNLKTICHFIRSKPLVNEFDPTQLSDYSLIKSIPNCFSMDSIHKFPLVFILSNHDKFFDKVNTLEINPKSLFTFDLASGQNEQQLPLQYPSLKNLIITNNVGECVNPSINGEEIASQCLKNHINQLERLDLNYNYSGLSLDGAMDLEKDLIDVQLLNELNTTKNTQLKTTISLKSIHSMSSLSVLYNNLLSKNLKSIQTSTTPIIVVENSNGTTTSPLVGSKSILLDVKLSKQCRDSIVDGEQQYKVQMVPFIRSLDIHYPENDFIFKHPSDSYLNLQSLSINLNTSSSTTNGNGSGSNTPSRSSPIPGGAGANNSNNTTGIFSQSTFLNLYLKNKKIKLSKLKFKTNSLSLINQLLTQSQLESCSNSIKTIEILVDLDTSTIHYDHMSIINGDFFATDLNQLFSLLEKNKSIEKVIISTSNDHNDMIFIDRDHWNRINTGSFKPIRLNSLNLFERFLS
ncbi:hypothetical protein RB653_010277 [Dictyostelium firmibasis]|uniref:Uncharacterized protein n=1 Tax=Dictyostelium firmibasis TaxID=79012 RepID=A0AAN7TSL3_9MYCE